MLALDPGFNDVSNTVATVSVLVVGVGVIWRKVVRPVGMAAKREIELRDWLYDQFGARNGEARLRDQITHMEEQMTDLQRTVQTNTGRLSKIEATLNDVQATTNTVADVVVDGSPTPGRGIPVTE